MTWFITFHTYGTRFHDPEPLAAWERRQMPQEPYLLCAGRREVVLAAIREACQDQGWGLLAVHVRTTHVHVVVETGPHSPGEARNLFKRRASQRLNEAGWDKKERRRWARHGHTRPVRQEAGPAIRYVVEGQGEPLAVWWAEQVGWRGERAAPGLGANDHSAEALAKAAEPG